MRVTHTRQTANTRRHCAACLSPLLHTYSLDLARWRSPKGRGEEEERERETSMQGASAAVGANGRGGRSRVPPRPSLQRTYQALAGAWALGPGLPAGVTRWGQGRRARQAHAKPPPPLRPSASRPVLLCRLCPSLPDLSLRYTTASPPCMRPPLHPVRKDDTARALKLTAPAAPKQGA